MKIGVTSTKHFASMAFRIDPSLHLSEGLQVREELAKSPYELITIKDASEKVFYGNIFSRVFVKDKEHGKTYLAASDTVLANIETGRYLSNKQSNQLKYLWLQKNWILVTCSGTLGNVTYTNSTFEDKIATHDLIRIVPNDNHILRGVVYAFLAGKYGYYQITQSQFGGVVKHINDKDVRSILIPNFPDTFQKEVDDLIQESARLREEAADMLFEAERLLKTSANLRDLTPEDYDYFGPRGAGREVSCFVRKRKDITTTTFNAFNLSERIKLCILDSLKQCNTISFYDAIDENKLQSPSGVEVNEVKEGFGIMLINQSDIFNQIIKGKYISKKKKYTKDLLKKGEILIAKIGTLGENETFCRCVYVGEELEGQLVSSAFYRMKPISGIPSGYLYTWLSSDYGFRLLRSSQFGTKQCYPNPTILYKYPIPILSPDIMNEIDQLVKEAHTKRYEANENERKAIRMVEEEIEKWNK
ncbi:restriction endonuclease subunit S [Parabacteroides distasonis]|nr:restriction endonuclease subunit S [Parabacteroides distasonis]